MGTGGPLAPRGALAIGCHLCSASGPPVPTYSAGSWTSLPPPPFAPLPLLCSGPDLEGECALGPHDKVVGSTQAKRTGTFMAIGR
jgi:hypothetical protein